MKKEDVEILDNISKMQNWETKTRSGYNDAVNRYIEFHGESLSELIKEAENEEDEGLPWRKRQLRTRLLNFRAFVYKKHLENTAKSYFTRVQTIYRFLEIELHKLPRVSEKVGNKAIPIYYEDLPTNEKIRLACDISDPLMTAILIFMSGSGQAKNETLNITIRDFIKATQKYHTVEIETTIDTTKYEGEVSTNRQELKIVKDDKIVTDHKEILNSIIKDLMIVEEKMYPDFQIKRGKTNKYYRTSCSDEATRAIVNYLLTRTDKIDFDNKLFKTNETYFFERFKEINKKLELGKIGNRNSFTSHMLRKFHASNLNKAVKMPDGTVEKGMEEDEIDALQGKVKVGTRKSYYFNDYDSLRERYIQFADRLKIYDSANESDFRTEKYKELEKQLKHELEEKNKIISNIAGENLKLKQDTEEFKNEMNKKIEKVNEKLTKHDPIIKKAEAEAEKEELINQILDDDNLIEILNSIHYEREDIDVQNIDFLREVVRLMNEKDLSKWKEDEIKKAINEIIDKVKPIDKMRIITKSLGKSNSMIKKLVGDKALLENLAKEVFEQMNTPFIKKQKK